MQATSNAHDEVIVTFARVPKHILDNPAAFHPRNDVFDGDPCLENQAVSACLCVRFPFTWLTTRIPYSDHQETDEVSQVLVSKSFG